MHKEIVFYNIVIVRVNTGVIDVIYLTVHMKMVLGSTYGTM